MLKWLLRLVWGYVWGKPTRPQAPVNLSSDGIRPFTYGNVKVRIFLNHSRTGKPYYKLKFNRLVKDERGKTNDFFVEDLADIERCIYRARAWMHDSNLVDD